MARLNTANPLVHAAVRQKKEPTTTKQSESQSDYCNNSLAQPQGSPKRPPQKPKCGSGAMFDIFPDPAIESGSSASNTPNKSKKTRALKATKANSLLLPLQSRPRPPTAVKAETDDYDKENDIAEDMTEPFTTTLDAVPPVRSSARREPNAARTRANRRPLSQATPDIEEEDTCEGDSFDSLDNFIVSDNEEISYHETSDSDTEEEKAPTPPPPKSTRKRLMRGRRPASKVEDKASNGASPRTSPALDPDVPKPPSTSKTTRKQLFQDDLNLSSQLDKLNLEDGNDRASQRERNSNPSTTELDSAPLATHQEDERPETPPSSPSKSRIRSPTKQKTRIPPTPHRESVDAFWSQEVTNDWIDQHSPRKETSSARSVIDLLKDFDNTDDEDSRNDSTSTDPDTAPITPKTPKTPSKTAAKKAEAAAKREAKARRASFNNKKAGLAETFLQVLDDTVTGGKVTQLAQETGGIQIIWSKTLLKTAGRAHWRSERVLSGESADKPTGSRYIHHHASIELAERIINDEYRLINTVTHEYCHLANYMISHVTDNPHGASFKAWGRKCSEAMKDHPLYGGKIEVTTKHSYEIEYKYVWECEGCGQTYGRHSKSIDPIRQYCGGCRRRLVQIKPKPRNVSPRKNPVTPNVQKKMMADVAKNLEGFTL